MHEDLFLHNTSGLNLHSMVLLTGVSYCDSNYLINRSNSKYSTLEYVLSGSGELFLNGTHYTVSEGDAYFLPAYQNQCYYPQKNSSWTKVFCNTTGTLTIKLAEEYSLSETVVFKNCDIKDMLFEMHEYKDLSLSPYELQEKSLALLQKIFLKIHYLTSAKNNYPHDLVRLIDYIDINITKAISLDELAHVIFRSKNHVINLFKVNLNTTPYEYFCLKKLSLSKKLLAETSMTVADISEYIGFNNPHYYSNCFKKAFNKTPLEFRKSKKLLLCNQNE